MNALDYILKANLYGLLFVGCYWLLLRRHTFFTLNRAYLLASVILSLILPLASLPAQTIETDWPVPVGVIALPVTAMATLPVETGPNWAQIAVFAYGFVAFVLLLRLAIRVGRLLWTIHQLPRQVHNDYVLVQLPETAGSTAPTFSFFRYLVLNLADAQNELIIRHELVHIRQRHSVDVLALALLRAIFWISPSLWLIDRMLRQVHEFLADKQASQPTVYARFLVEYAFGAQTNTLTNGFFNPSLLTQRILMLHQRATNRWALGKYVLVLPLVFGLLAMTTTREEVADMVNQAANKDFTVSGLVTGLGKPLPGVHIIVKGINQGTDTNSDGSFNLANVPKTASLIFSLAGFTTLETKVNGHSEFVVNLGTAIQKPDAIVAPTDASSTPPESQTGREGAVFTVVEVQPQFPGGMRALGDYINKNLRYPTEARKKKVEGRVFVRFVVSQTGDIQDVQILKGIGSGCDEESVRVVSQMPKWVPGKQAGSPVNVQYNLPIQFSLEKKEDKRTGQIKPVPKLDSVQKVGFIIDNSKNAPYALYNDVKSKTYPFLDSLPKSRTAVTIRGKGPLGELGSEPLYIIDGIEIPKDTPKPLDKVSPNDIENINVLKGESAASAYGEKGKNGVILITTKKK